MNITATATFPAVADSPPSEDRDRLAHDRQLRHARCFVGDYLRDMNVRDPIQVYELTNRVMDTIDVSLHCLTTPQGARCFRREVLEKTVAMCDQVVSIHLGDGGANHTVLRGATQSLLNKESGLAATRLSRMVAPQATPRAMGPREPAAHMTVFRREFWARLARPVVRLYAS